MERIWLIGAGLMAIDYAKVLKDLEVEVTVVGRGTTSASNFEKETGYQTCAGGLEMFLKTSPPIPDGAIVAVGIEDLAETAIALMKFGIKKILLEKPGVGYAAEMDKLSEIATMNKAKVLLAYNRRFYSSVIKAQELIEQDGGVKSINFEFTEWSHVIRPLKKHIAEHHNWFLGNSTHIVDTAFFMAGKPTQLCSFVKGGIDWHPKSSIFAGAGITSSDALFSYHANWEAPGRWVIEVLTNKSRLLFKPIETLQIQLLGSVAVNPVEIDDKLDKKYKPGLYRQTQAFINWEIERFCSLSEQKEAMKYYLKMSGY